MGPWQEGSLRWKIDSEKCYHFWTLSGTDCGRCITVCPYSHRNNRVHRFVRWEIKNNLFFRYLAIKLDDIFLRTQALHQAFTRMGGYYA
jgi:ferredoxin